MAKSGYLIAVLLIAALGTYALWPAPALRTAKLLDHDAAPTAWSSLVDGLTVEVAPDQVRVTRAPGPTAVFAPDSEKIGGLWGALSRIEVPAAKAIAGVGEAQLAGYGLAAARQASAADGSAVVRWGAAGGQAYVWNGLTRTLLAADPGQIALLDAMARPPIRAAVLQLSAAPKRVTVDGLVLVPDGGSWRADLYRNRPPFDVRLTHLLGLLGQIQVTDFTGEQAIGLPLIGSLAIAAVEGTPAAFSAGPLPARDIGIHDRGADGVITITGYPPQRIAAELRDQLRQALAAFRRDILVDLAERVPPAEMLRIELERDGAPWWSLRRREKPPQVGGVAWDVVWSGGRESAPDDAVQRLSRLLAEAAVRDPVADDRALDGSAGGIRITAVSERADTVPLRAVVAGGELRSATHRARLLDEAALVAALGPDRFLDDRLIRRDASRVAKIQRRFHTDATAGDEVVTRSEGGTWSRTWPADGVARPAVDVAAIDRLIRALAAARMREVRLVAAATPGGGHDTGVRELIDRADFELAVRFAPRSAGQAANDDTDLDESAAQDWGFAAMRAGAAWDCVDRDLGLRFTLDADTVDELRRPLTADEVFPVVASAVTAATIAAALPGTPVALARTASGWTVDGVAADPLAVRRWLRDLGALRAVAPLGGGPAFDPRAPEPTPGEIVARITCEVPAVSGDPYQTGETLTLAVLAATDRGRPVHVWSNRGGSRFPRGRAVVTGPALAAVLVDAAAFRR